MDPLESDLRARVDQLEADREMLYATFRAVDGEFHEAIARHRADRRLMAALRQTQIEHGHLLAGIVTQLHGTTGEVRVLKTEVDELKTDVTAIKTEVTTLKTDVSELKTDVTAIKTEVTTLKTDVSELKTDVSELKTDVTAIKTEVTTLKTDVSELKTDVSELKTGMAGVVRGQLRLEELIRLGLNMPGPDQN